MAYGQLPCYGPLLRTILVHRHRHCIIAVHTQALFWALRTGIEPIYCRAFRCPDCANPLWPHEKTAFRLPPSRT